MRYIPNTPENRKEMFERIGAKGVQDFLDPIPEDVLLDRALKLPEALSEMELLKYMKELSGKNTTLDDYPSFLGGGAYDHFIPCTIDHLISRGEFFTAYTPYQAEVSQGTLQSIYEYQTMICELTGMDVSNASLYEGGSGVAEAAIMSVAHTRKKKVFVSSTLHPEYIEVLKTYAWAQDIKVEEIPIKEGTTKVDLEVLKERIDKDTASVILQYPNFFGSIEELEKVEELLKGTKALFVVVANPILLGVLKAPGDYGAHIVVGEGQPFGNPVSFGGPYLGYIACKKKYFRRLPGRLSGGTEDQNKEQGFVMTLQAREQHIRREKATSNICSNEALNALIATIYLSIMGPEGLKEVASQSLKKAHYLASALEKLPNISVETTGPFGYEFMITTPLPVKELNERLFEKGIIGGLDLGRFNKEWEKKMLVCVTEKRTREEIDSFVKNLEVLT